MQKNKKKGYLIIKRLADILVSGIGLLILAPLFVIIAILIKIDSKGSFLFKHKRVGQNGKIIYLYKFRTMVDNADNLINNFTEEQKKEYYLNYKLKKDPRITRFGSILRKTSLDELPQLLNIFCGNMSLIGPRPVIADELLKYGKEKERILSVKPGLTGWWACNGRSDLSYDERIKLELYYVDNYSLKLDVICFLKTIVCVFKGLGSR